MSAPTPVPSAATSSAVPVSSSAAAAADHHPNRAHQQHTHQAAAAVVFAGPPIWTMNGAAVHAWMRTVPSIHTPSSAILWKNLQTAITACHVVPVVDPKKKEAVAVESATKKRRYKLATLTGPVLVQDSCHVWLHGERYSAKDDETRADLKLTIKAADGQVVLTQEAASDMPTCIGGKLAQLSVGGLLNGLCGITGGMTKEATPASVIASFVNPIPSAANLTGPALLQVAVQWHRSIAVRVRADILRTTPQRIHEMLAPDLDLQEFAAVRKRVYETVILGKGLNVGGISDEAELPTAAGQAVHDLEKFKKCSNCGNNEQSSFVLDRKNGDVICSNCGTVVSESLMHEGSQFRKFEGEVDRNHHGDMANPLYSNQHNMSTTLGGVTQVSGAGIGGWGSQSRSTKNLETILRNAHAYTELNVSQFGKTDRRTRVGYKDKQKKEAFVNMAHVGDALNLHEAVVQRAKEVFAGFRDDRELVQQFKGVIAACLCEAFEQLSVQGKAILKQEQEEVEKVAVQQHEKTQLSARATRRNELHHANLAGKGGLMLDLSSVQKDKADTNGVSPKAEEKPAASWDLEDCRSWLLDASRNIAQQWVTERNKGGPTSKKIPAGSSDELEGQLVEHSIALCEQLEKELKSRQSRSHGSKRVVTPRVSVQDMSKLGIKWQKLGDTKPSATDGERKAGQILTLKTAKKLGDILKDAVAGEAIHKELRLVVGRQQERKRKDVRDEASRQRFSQMKRKPWLQARAQMET